METPATRLTRKSSEFLRQNHDTSNSSKQQKTLHSFFSKKKVSPEGSPTPKKKQKIATPLRGSRETTPKKIPPAQVQPAEIEEEKTDKLPRNQKQLEKLLNKVKQKMSLYRNVFFQEQRELQGFLIFLMKKLQIKMYF